MGLVEAPAIDFYRLWLGPELETGCAWFEAGHEALARAQLDSLRRLCRLLDLQRGHMVLDAGGGHGAFARLAAREFGASVLCLAPTVAALEHASNRLRAERLQSRVRVELLAGFRPPAEGFDRIVSTNLLAATDFPFASDVMAATLRPGGRFIGHFVLSTPGKKSSRTRDEGEAESADCRLPALSLPSTTRAERQLCSAGLVTAERRSLRLHLGITLEHWHRNLEDHLPQAHHLLPPAVLADWRAQLAASVKALRRGGLQLQEVVATKR